MISQRDRIEHISDFILEIAGGNFNAQIKRSENDDELDAIVQGINMLREELKASTVSRDYMNSIYQGVVDLLFVMDKDFIIQSINNAAVQSLGLVETEIVGRPFIFLVKDLPATFTEIRKELDAGRNVNNIELQMKAKTGAVIPVSCAISSLYNARSQKSGIMIIAKDITLQKRAQKELQRAKEVAEAANVAKSRFLANMSHEIRTPLNGILGLTEILLEESTNPKHKEYLDIIRSSGRNLTRIINDILDLSKIESGKISLEKIRFNFAETIKSHIHPYKHLAQQRGIDLQYHFEQDLYIDVIGDPTRINQILVNLLSNALKFTEAGTVNVHFTQEKNDGKVVVIKGEVIDTGIGISSEKQKIIFQSFTQADDSVTRKYGGTGLGLTIVESLVKQMEGEIKVKSPVDATTQKGTSFTFTIKLGLPLTKGEEKPPVPKEPEKLKFSRQLNILLVDDNEINLLVTKTMLQNFGAKVTLAQNGLEALNQAKAEEFDVILMDIQMPIMDGYNATIELRNMKFKNPIIAVSANAYSDHIKKSIECGMNSHLQKPFSPQQLYNVITQYVG